MTLRILANNGELGVELCHSPERQATVSELNPTRAISRNTVVCVHTAPRRGAGTPRSASAAASPCIMLTPASRSAVTSNISRCATSSAPSRRTRAAAAASGPVAVRWPRSPPSTRPTRLRGGQRGQCALANQFPFLLHPHRRAVRIWPAGFPDRARKSEQNLC